MKKKIIILVLIALLLTAGVAVAVLLLLPPEALPLPPVISPSPPMPDLQQVEAPPGAQLFLLPMDDGVITAGYQNASYREKNGFPHYGLDITAANGKQADILASGNGVVLGTEFCDNNMGHIAVLRYDNVYIPETGETLSLIARYYHMTYLQIGEGDRVTAGQVMGAIDRSHDWWHHIHLELDTDLDYPFHTPQVAETSSQLLHRYPASGDSMLDPILVLVAGKGQSIYRNPNASNTEKDEPRYAAGQGQ